MATIIGELKAIIGADTSQLKKAEIEMRSFSNNAQRNLAKTEKGAASLTSQIKALAVAVGAYKVAQVAANAVLQGARFKTLGVVMDTVGRNAGFSADQMEGFAKGLQKTGIAMLESRLNLTKMAQAQLDLTKSSQLARVAQDAAVIGGIDSSEAFSKMIHAIQTGRVAVLQTIGLNVQFGQSYKDLAKKLGVATTDLTDMQRAQARMNVVLEAGERIAGSYEAAMGTAAKKLGSMNRPLSNLAVTFGQAFDPEFGVAIDDITRSIKDLTEYLKQPDNQQALKDTATSFGLIAKAALWLGKTTGKAVAGLDLNLFAKYGETVRAFQELEDSIKSAATGKPTGTQLKAMEAQKLLQAQALEDARKLAEARKVIQGEQNRDELKTMTRVTMKTREELSKRLENYSKFYDDLQKRIETHTANEMDNIRKLNDLYRQQMTVRRSTESMLGELGGPVRSAIEQFNITRRELSDQFDAAQLLGGQDQINALEQYKQSVKDLALEFSEGAGRLSGGEIATQARRDIQMAFELQKEVMEELTLAAEDQIETNKMWGETLAAESKKAAIEIEDIKILMGELDTMIAEMDTAITLSVNDLATFDINRIRSEIEALHDKTITVTVNYVSNNQGGGGPAGPALDSFASGTNFVPQTGLYELHKGEAVVPADKNMAGAAGGKLFENLNITPTPEANGKIDWRRVVSEEIVPELERVKRG